MYTNGMKQLHEYIASRVIPSDTLFEGTPCLEWTLRIHQRGYGVAKIKGVSVWAHRLSYELNVGKIPGGYTVDHRCFNKVCLNPKHLEAVTTQENTRRYRVRFMEQNPNFPCGHSRVGATAEKFSAGKYKSGTTKNVSRCGLCTREYMKKYLKRYLKTYRKKTVVD